MIHRRHLTAVLIAAGLAATACGADSDSSSGGESATGSGSAVVENADDDLDEFADALNQASGAGGGGVLVFDGATIPIESAVCVLDDSRIDIGTVGQNYRVFVSGDPGDLNLQILDPEGIQWFDGGKTPEGPPDAQATIEGNVVVGAENVWWNNQDDREITASFTIECP